MCPSCLQSLKACMIAGASSPFGFPLALTEQFLALFGHGSLCEYGGPTCVSEGFQQPLRPRHSQTYGSYRSELHAGAFCASRGMATSVDLSTEVLALIRSCEGVVWLSVSYGFHMTARRSTLPADRMRLETAPIAESICQTLSETDDLMYCW